MSCRWTFSDPSIPIVESFEVNPNSGGSPARRKTTSTQKTTAPDGVPLIFEGVDEPLEFEWAGVFLSETQLTMFQTWYEKHHQIKLTDDLNRESWIYITAFDLKRERASNHPFKHSYTAKATLLDWS